MREGKDAERVRLASIDFLEFYVDWVRKHKLSGAEAINMLSQQIMVVSKYLVRAERNEE